MHDKVILMTNDRIDRSLKRIALQIWEDMGSEAEPVFIGLNERGYAVATKLHSFFEKYSSMKAKLLRFEVLDNEFMGDKPMLEGKYVIIVDDVIFSAATMFKAIAEITKEVTVSELKTALLVDRGHRRFPVLSTYVGLEHPTKLDERVDMTLKSGEAYEVILTTHD